MHKIIIGAMFGVLVATLIAAPALATDRELLATEAAQLSASLEEAAHAASGRRSFWAALSANVLESIEDITMKFRPKAPPQDLGTASTSTATSTSRTSVNAPTVAEYSTQELVALARRRKQLLLELAATDPDKIPALTLSKQERQKLPKAVQAEMEKDLVSSGTLYVLHVDTKNSSAAPEKAKYYFASGKSIKPVYSVHALPTDAPQYQAKVNGVEIGPIVVAQVQIRKRSALRRPAPVKKESTAVFLVNEVGTTPPFSVAEAEKVVFNGQFQKYYREQSYGEIAFEGRAFGWFSIPPSVQGACGVISFEGLAALAKQEKIDLSRYGRIIILASPGYGGCSTVGKIGAAGLNASWAWIGTSAHDAPHHWSESPRGFPWTNLDDFLTHEMGHSLGLLHANGFDCGSEAAGGDCKHIEYGDYFDVMGTGLYALGLSTPEKELMGWVKPANLQTITKSGVYTLSLLDTRDHPKLRRIAGAKIAIPGMRYPIYLETREAREFDRTLALPGLSPNLRGVFVRRWVAIPGYPWSWLFDASPINQVWWGDDIQAVTLNEGGIFNDRKSGLTIETVQRPRPIMRATTTVVKVSIVKPSCVPAAPQIMETAGGYWAGMEKQTLAYASIQIRNDDPYTCDASNFKVQFVAPPGWKFHEGREGSATIPPEEMGYFFAILEAPQNLKAGTYDISYTATNTKSGAARSGKIQIFYYP